MYNTGLVDKIGNVVYDNLDANDQSRLQDDLGELKSVFKNGVVDETNKVTFQSIQALNYIKQNELVQAMTRAFETMSDLVSSDDDHNGVFCTPEQMNIRKIEALLGAKWFDTETEIGPDKLASINALIEATPQLQDLNLNETMKYKNVHNGLKEIVQDVTKKVDGKKVVTTKLVIEM